jgi:uncharacterized protein YciI
MKKLLIACTLLIGINSVVLAQNQNVEYDAALALKLGADDYGMKSYMLVILKTGPVQVEDRTVRDSLFAGHLQNIGRLADEGKLVLAGPLGSNPSSFRGIFILDVKTREEAEELLQTDPVIKEGLLDADIFPWYGSAALPEYLKVHRKIEKMRP